MNANNKVQDGIIARSVELERLKKQTLRRMLSILRDADQDIIAQINNSDLTEFQLRRIQGISKRIRELLAESYKLLGEAFDKELEGLVGSELRFITGLLDDVVGINWAASPTVSVVYSAAYAQPFQGSLLREYYKNLPDSVGRLIDRQIRIGFTQGETRRQVVARVRKVLKGQRVNFSSSIVNTAMSHFSHVARMQTYKQNADAFKGLKWISTIDTRTSDICQYRDGRIYPIDNPPSYPAHFNERSTMVPELKSWKQFPHDVPEETRASMDGQISNEIVYTDWIDDQSFTRQSQAIGRRRAELIRGSDLSAGDLFGRDRILPLAEIEKKFPQQWAGVFGD